MIDPRFMIFSEWAALTRARLPDYDDIPIPAEDSNWKQWAELILRVPSIARRRPPLPGVFGDWREWAFFFNRAMML